MRTDSIIQQEGFNALMSSLNIVEIERFIVILNRGDFDYTVWRKGLWEDLSLEELSDKAMKYSQEN